MILLIKTSRTSTTYENIKKTSQNKKIGLARWCTDGSFIDFTPANTYPPELISIGPTAIDDNGKVVIGGSMKGSVNFGDEER